MLTSQFSSRGLIPARCRQTGFLEHSMAPIYLDKKVEAKEGEPEPRKDLVKQIENWRTVLANYRAATIKDQAESVADQLSLELNGIRENFQSFLVDATSSGSSYEELDES